MKKEPELVYMPPSQLDYIKGDMEWTEMINSNLSTQSDWSFLNKFNLTPPEQEVVPLKWGKCWTNKQIANHLGVTRRAVNKRVRKIKDKLTY